MRTIRIKKRVLYFLRRAREAGPRNLWRKAQQRVSPFLYWPSYASGKLCNVERDNVKCLRAFGKVCTDAFRYSFSKDSERANRGARRLELARSPEFPILGYGGLPKPSGDGWHQDSLHHHKWRARYFPLCDFVANDVRADVKIPWEFSRLQWLPWLAEAATIAELKNEERDELGRLVFETVNEWATSNPVGYGINWACGMEVAIRAVNIAVAASVFSDSFHDDEIGSTVQLLRAHQRFLERFPEVSDVPGNHYLADLMGEVVLHAALDGEASTEIRDALDRFADAADRQFEPEGCHIERAPVYHRLAYEMVALPYALAIRIGHRSAETMARTLHRAASFMAQVTSDTGRLPVFGDQDSGFVLWFGESAQTVDRRICSAPGATDTDLHDFLRGIAGDPAYFPRTIRQAGSRSGFGTLANRRIRVTMKTGPQGLSGRAPHDHDDALSLAISWQGHDLIIDPGCHSYTLDSGIRHETLISSRHNAPVPAERERFVPTVGSINATVRGAPVASLTEFSHDSMEGKIDTPSSRFSVTRTVTIGPDALVIDDTWGTPEPERVRIKWLIDPGWRVDPPAASQLSSEGLHLVLTKDATRLLVTILAFEGELTVKNDSYSPDYGAYSDCTALHVEVPSSAARAARLAISEI